MKIYIKNGTVVTPEKVFKGDIEIDHGKITNIATDLDPGNNQVVEANGMYVLPGAIDSHTHFDLDTGFTKTADDFITGSKAALVGGTTTFIDFATQEKKGSLQSALKDWHKKAQGTFCDYSFHMAIVDYNENTPKEMAECIKEGVTTFKLYMAYKGNLQVDDGVIYKALKEAKKIDGLIGFHCENGDLIDIRMKENLEKGNITPYYHMQTRPNEVEAEAVQRVLAIGKLADAPVWVVHLSTKEGLEFIKQARKNGQQVVAETCPQYLVLDKSCYKTSDYSEFDTAKYVMSPPLRSKEDQQALWKALDEDIDFISTDHCSFNLKEQKEYGKENFTKIPNGGPGVEDRVLLLYTYGVCEEKITITQMVKLLSEMPAKRMGLINKGTLEIGKDADIVLLNPNSQDVFSVKTQTQNVDYNSYEGLTRKGKIEKVFLRGNLVVENGKLIEQLPLGKYQPRSKPEYE